MSVLFESNQKPHLFDRFSGVEMGRTSRTDFKSCCSKDGNGWVCQRYSLKSCCGDEQDGFWIVVQLWIVGRGMIWKGLRTIWIEDLVARVMVQRAAVNRLILYFRLIEIS
jgi:hypothetical protein